MNPTVLTTLGLSISETGQITGIELPISDSPLLAAGMQRRVRLKRLSFDDDLEMNVVFELRVVDADGRDLFDLYNQDHTLPPFVARERMARVQPIEVPRTTRHCYRDAETGQITSADAKTAVPELQFFQTLALAHLKTQGLPLSGKEPYLVVVYLMLANIIREKDALNEF